MQKIRILFFCLIFSLIFCFPIPFAWSSPVRSSVSVKEKFAQVARSFLEGEYSKALRFSWQLRQEFPSSPYAKKAKYLSALSYLKTEHLNQAKQIFRDLREERGGGKERYYLGEANLYYLTEDWERCISTLEQMLSKFPSSSLKAAAYFRLGRCKQKKGVWEGAKYYFTKLLQQFPSSLEAKEAEKILEKGEFYFTLQIGAFKKKENAQKMKYYLKEKGYPAYISIFEKDGRELYRLRVGKFNLRKEAEAVRRRLEAEGYKVEIYP